MIVPERPKIYHIVHWDRLPGIIEHGCLWSHLEVGRRALSGTTIGFEHVKDRRKEELLVSCHEGLRVGACVPFNFCPRSVMLYVLFKRNSPSLTYFGGEEPIVHLEADLFDTVEWAMRHNHRWAFTTSNAGEWICDFYRDLAHLGVVNWDAVQAKNWTRVRAHKQAEFLIEASFPWTLIERIGVHFNAPVRDICNIVATARHRPIVEKMKEWYYGTS